jgi:hypothetical protein
VDEHSFRCATCGELHSGAPDWAFDQPFHYAALSDHERLDAQLTSDWCVIGEDRFVRGVLRIQVGDEQAGFCYGVWVSLSHQHFSDYMSQFDAVQPLQQAPWFGWLCNRIPGYPDTLLLKTRVTLQPFPARPQITLEPTSHPLSLEQQHGITWERLREILETLEHPPREV